MALNKEQISPSFRKRQRPRKGVRISEKLHREIVRHLDGASDFRRMHKRPFITLSYAQSIDGSIAGRCGQPMSISCPETLTLAHQLRAWHDGILVGIGTVLADNPYLTVRRIAGQNPQPIVLDSYLRFPLNANLLSIRHKSPWIFTTSEACYQKETALRHAGSQIFRLEANEEKHISLPKLMQTLGEMKMNSLMVEGGAQIISHLLAARLADQLVVTISPCIIGGLRAVQAKEDVPLHARLNLQNVQFEQIGADMVMRADLSEKF